MPPSIKTYLGDSVYADIEHGMIKLTSENGDREPLQTIYLEPAVYDALTLWVYRIKNTDS